MDGGGQIIEKSSGKKADPYSNLSRRDFSRSADILKSRGVPPSRMGTFLKVIDPKSPFFKKRVRLVGVDTFNRGRIAVTVEGNLDNQGRKAVYFLPKSQFKLPSAGGPK